MKMAIKKVYSLGLLILSLLMVVGCGPSSGKTGTQDLSERMIEVTATTSMVADLVRVVGGDRVQVSGLMGPGVDPHLFKASEGDVAKMAGADVIFYNGLHLEGKMTEVFEQMSSRSIPTIAVAEGGIEEEDLLDSEAFTGNYDPHVWFDVALWQKAARYVADELAAIDPTHADTYAQNADAYVAELEELKAYIEEQVRRVPEAQRVLVTSHDAFGYFGAAYGFEVLGLQGISTATEAGTADVQQLAETVAERRIPALFIESSVSPRGIQAVREAVRARGYEVQIGGTLYGDALGNPGTPEESYIGTVRHNVDTIVGALMPATNS